MSDLREKTRNRFNKEQPLINSISGTVNNTIQLPIVTVNMEEEPPTFADILYKTAINMGYVGSQSEFEKDFSSISKIDDMTIDSGIQGITLGNETTLIEQANRIVNIPIATTNALGVIKGSDSGVLINTDGTLNIKKVRASALYADTNEDKVYWECGNSIEEG